MDNVVQFVQPFTNPAFDTDGDPIEVGIAPDGRVSLNAGWTLVEMEPADALQVAVDLIGLALPGPASDEYEAVKALLAKAVRG